MKTGALILASFNYETILRDRGEVPAFLPMQVLDGITAIKREIAALRKAALSPILVLTGHEAETLRNHLVHNQVICIEDGGWREHDRAASLRAGLLEAGKHMERVVVLPAEYPAFSQELLEKLLACEGPAVPVHEGKEGWPRLYVPGKKSGEVTRLPVKDAGCVLSLLAENGLKRAEEYIREQRERKKLAFRFRLILEKEEEFFGPGVYEFLRRVAEAGPTPGEATPLKKALFNWW